MNYIKTILIIFLISLTASNIFAEEEKKQEDKAKLDLGYAIGVKYAISYMLYTEYTDFKSLFIINSNDITSSSNSISVNDIGLTNKIYLSKNFGFTIDLMLYNKNLIYDIKALFLEIPITYDTYLVNDFFLSFGINYCILLDGFKVDHYTLKDKTIGILIKIGTYLTNNLIVDLSYIVSLESAFNEDSSTCDGDCRYLYADCNELRIVLGVSYLFSTSYNDKGCIKNCGTTYCK